MKTQEEMSKEYREYLNKHIENINNGFEWLKLNFDLKPWLKVELSKQVATHDVSKYDLDDEFFDYMMYFYSDEQSKGIENAFNKAWLHHIHKNPHHWQHWVLIEDDGNQIAIDMPLQYIYEMILDWWSFSWGNNNLYEIFDWYDNHKKKMILSENTRLIVEQLLNTIKEVLDAK